MTHQSFPQGAIGDGLLSLSLACLGRLVGLQQQKHLGGRGGTMVVCVGGGGGGPWLCVCGGGGGEKKE